MTSKVFFTLPQSFGQKPFSPSQDEYIYIIEVRKLKSARKERRENFWLRVKKKAIIRGKKRNDTIEHLQNTLLVRM